MTEKAESALAFTAEEIELAYQMMLSINGSVGLRASSAQRHPLLLAEAAAWVLSAAIFLSLRDNYRAAVPRLSDQELDSAIEQMKSYVGLRADQLLASIQLGRDQAAAAPAQHASASVN